MGCSLSRSRRRRASNDGEREPLLRRDTTHSPLEKLADILAALHAGKLPTQDQINRMIQCLLKSEFLEESYNAVLKGFDGTLEADRRKLVSDVREVAETVVQLGVEKNNDDLIQSILHRSRSLVNDPMQTNLQRGRVQSANRNLDTLVSTIPSKDETKSDISVLISSLRTLIILLFTSTAFRDILSNVLAVTREFVADTAHGVSESAAVVEELALKLEADARPGGSGCEDSPSPLHGYHDHDSAVKNTPRTKAVILDRMEDIITQAHAEPTHVESLRAIVSLFKKYLHRIQTALSVTSEISNHVELATIVPDPALRELLVDIKTLLERFASYHSLDTCASQISQTISVILAESSSSSTDVGSMDVGILKYFEDLGTWLEHALSRGNQTYASSRQGRCEAERLYDRGRPTLSSGSKISSSMNMLLDELDSFISSLGSDRTTTRLVSAFSTLLTDLHVTSKDTASFTLKKAKRWRTDLFKLFGTCLLPNLLKILRVIPMPRVEYVDTSTGLEVSVNSTWLGVGADVVPDVVRVCESSEVVVDFSGQVGRDSLPQTPGASDETFTDVTSVSKILVHLEGIRLSVYDVGYYVHYAYRKSRWLTYSDEGLLTVEIGKQGIKGDGARLDIEVELDATSSGESNNSTVHLRPTLVLVDLPGLSFTISHSRHWIINAVLQPVLGPIVKKIVKGVLESQIRTALEGLETRIRDVNQIVEETRASRDDESDSSLGDYWWVLVDVFGCDLLKERDENESEDGMDEYSETQTHATFGGITRTTFTQPEPSTVSSQIPKPEPVPQQTETIFAVGFGAQVLPGKGDPSRISSAGDLESQSNSSPLIGSTMGYTKDVGTQPDEGVHRVGGVQVPSEDAQKRYTERRGVKERGRRWRSRAFDL